MSLVFSPEVWGSSIVASWFCGWVLGYLYGVANTDNDGCAAGEDTLVEEVDSLFTLPPAPKVAPNITAKSSSTGCLALDASAHNSADAPRVDPVPAEGASAVAVNATNPIDRQRAESKESNQPETAVFYSNCCTQSSDLGSTLSTALNAHLISGFLPLAEVRAHARHLLATNKVWETPEMQGQVAEFLRAVERKSADLLSHCRGSIQDLQLANDSELDDEPHRPTRRFGTSIERKSSVGTAR